jgi:hypothetical protein
MIEPSVEVTFLKQGPEIKLIRLEDSVGMSVFKVHISATRVFTPKLMLPYRNVRQHQRVLMVYTENVHFGIHF